jgi:putative transposase
MNKINQIRTGRHCKFNMHVHLVFVTKYRKKIFTQKTLNILNIIFSNVCDDFGATLIEMDGEKDHVHLLIEYPPKVSVAALVNSLKGVSSRLLRKHLPLMSQYYWKGVLWSPSYFAASCGGAPVNIVKQYIQQQASPD